MLDELAEGEAHVWWAWLDRPAQPVESLAATLSADEQQRATRFLFERDRQRFRTGRGLLRVLLGRYLGLEPAGVSLGYTGRGKPALAGEQAGSGLKFNLAHSGHLIVFAFARRQEIGVDVEELRPLPSASSIARRFFSAGECERLAAVPPDRSVEAFFNCWTRKEAYIKAAGEGLALALDRFEVELWPDAPARILTIDGDTAAAARWTIHTWQPEPGYLASLAAPEPGWRMRGRAWPPGRSSS